MMRFLIIFLVIGMFACKSNNESTSLNDNVNHDAKLLVYNFYGTHRCPSCLSIENVTKQTLEQNYSDLLKNNIIKLYSLNIDEPENSKIAEKYQAFGSGLMLVYFDKGEEKVIDLTGDGFKFALHKPEKFTEILKNQIDEILKQ